MSEESREGPLEAAALAFLETMKALGKTAAFAESCTGGLLAQTLTELPGASKVFWGGVVSYSEEAKAKLLGVSEETISGKGVVSVETALEMAQGLRSVSEVDLAIAVTGWAGPEAPESEAGPGRVCIAWADRSGSSGLERRFGGSRENVRRQAAAWALEEALAFMGRAGLPSILTLDKGGSIVTSMPTEAVAPAATGRTGQWPN